MDKGFSFNTDSCLLVMNHLMKMMPAGVEFFAYYLRYDYHLCFANLKNEKLDLRQVNDANEKLIVNDFRKRKKAKDSWIIKNKLPLINQYAVNTTNQFDIFDEDNHLVLCIRFNSMFDNNNDVVCIVFQPELNIFGIETGKISLTTEHKNIIANILYRSSISVLSNGEQDKKCLNQFSEKTKSVIDKGRTYKKHLKESRDDYHRNIIIVAETYLQDFAKTMGVDFTLSSESKDLLKHYSGNPLRLKEILEEAARFAMNLNLNSKTLVIIEEDFIELSKSDIIETDNNSVKHNISISKHNFSMSAKLDEYENAVKSVLASKLKPTGQNVGDALEKPISAAAITDYIKKYQDEINELLESYPMRWSLMREHFRPLKNIISHKALPNAKSM